ncbi:MAG: glycosyltransferase [Betaproteobacteria bacterium]
MTTVSTLPAKPDSPARVTVILSSYNHSKYLRESIESVLNQTYTQFDLVIWDDASTDDSWQIISGYQDSRIRAFRNSVNLRDSYRLAMRTYKDFREFVAIHHSDDAWEPDKLRKQVELLDAQSQVGAVFTRVRVVNETGGDFANRSHPYATIFEQGNKSRHDWLRQFFLRGNCLCHPSVLMRKSVYDALGGYRNGLAQLSDLDLWIRICMRADIHILDERLTRFRVRDDEANMSGNRADSRMRLRFETLKVMDSFLAFQTAADFNKVFAKEWKDGVLSDREIPYALARILLQFKPFDGANLFALNLLFRELNSAESASLMQERFGFSHADFMNLSGSHETGIGVSRALGIGNLNTYSFRTN